MRNLLAHARHLAVPILLALAWPAGGQPPGQSAGEMRTGPPTSAGSREPFRGTAALQQLEDELAQLRQAAGSTRSEMATLRRRIDEAQPGYLAPRMAQLLALLGLATVAAAALVAWRARPAGAAAPWRRPGEAAPPEPRAAEAPAAAAAPVRPAPRHPDTDAAPGPVRPASSGLLRVETLAAILQEVDFLASLGLHAQAMDVLEAYLEHSASPAPAAFFELMRVRGLAEDPQAVEAVRRRYTQVHGVPAPTLAQVGVEGGLEQQRALVDRVTRAWGTPAILALIEQALFDAPPPDAPVPVQVARELICLYELAMVLDADAGAEGCAPWELPLAPWPHAEHPGEAQAYAQAVGEDAGGHRFALDIDLSVVPQALPDKPPQPSAEELAGRLLAEKQAAHAAAERAARAAEEAFSAAVASERAPTSRF